MLINELIDELQQIKAQFGNINVSIAQAHTPRTKEHVRLTGLRTVIMHGVTFPAAYVTNMGDDSIEQFLA